MHIELHIPRPMIALLTVAAISGWAVAFWPSGTQTLPASAIMAQADAVPTEQAAAREKPLAEENAIAEEEAPHAYESQDTAPEDAVRLPTEAEERARRIREEQEVLQAKEQILRSQLSALEQELDRTPNPSKELQEQLRSSTRMLVSLMQDSQKAEQFLLTSLSQIWEAEGKAIAVAAGTVKNLDHLALLWPVEPLKGISAYFHDKAYQQRFKMQHNAVDIPAPQGTMVLAAAGGVIKDVVDHGLGFNYITVEHPGGYSTLYGHLSKFAVEKGQTVVAGDIIGYSGGRPGTPGAGFSTGPHLHFGVFMSGAAVDPMPFLPKLAAK